MTRLVDDLVSPRRLAGRRRAAAPDKYVEEFRHMFRCPYVFDAPVNTLVFEASFLAKPVIRNRDELKQFLSTAPLGFLMTPSDETSVARRIRTILMAERKLPLEFPSVDEIAAELDMTEQDAAPAT